MKTKGIKTTPMQTRVYPELLSKFDEIAVEQCATRSQVLRNAMEQEIERHEERSRQGRARKLAMEDVKEQFQKAFERRLKEVSDEADT